MLIAKFNFAICNDFYEGRFEMKEAVVVSAVRTAVGKAPQRDLERYEAG